MADKTGIAGPKTVSQECGGGHRWPSFRKGGLPLNRRSDFWCGLPHFATEVRFFLRALGVAVYITSLVVALWLTLVGGGVLFNALRYAQGPTIPKGLLVGAAVYFCAGSLISLYRPIVRLGRKSW